MKRGEDLRGAKAPLFHSLQMSGQAETPSDNFFSVPVVKSFYGISSNFPVVFRPSKSRCACCASLSG